MRTAPELVRRWDALLVSIQRDFERVLADAGARSEPLIATMEGDFGPLSRLWMSVKAQMHDHQERVSEAWEEISDEADEVDMDLRTEGDKRDLTTCELEIAYTRAYRQVMARAAEALRARVVDDASARMFAASGGRLLGEWAAHDAWEDMKRAEARIHGFRDRREVPLELLERYERSCRAYWTHALETEARLVPELAQYVASKLAMHMAGADKLLKEHWQWRAREAR